MIVLPGRNRKNFVDFSSPTELFRLNAVTFAKRTGSLVFSNGIFKDPNRYYEVISKPLENGTYKIKIVSEDNLGNVNSGVIAQGTISTLILPPRNLRVRSVNKNVVTLSWDAPISGSPDYYRIYGNDGSGVIINRNNLLAQISGILETADVTVTIQGTENTNMVLLLHMDGTDGSQDFEDSSNSDHQFTSVNGAYIDTAQGVFNQSGRFQGNYNYITCPGNSVFSLGGTGAGNDWTIDFRVRWNAALVNVEFLSTKLSTGATDGWKVFFATNRLQLSANGISSNQIWAPVADTWYHIAYVKSGTTITVYVEGTALGTLTDVDMDSKSQPLIIGGDTKTLDGWMDEVRILKGVAEWTSDFTPDDEPYRTGDYINTDWRFVVEAVIGDVETRTQYIVKTEVPGEEIKPPSPGIGGIYKVTNLNLTRVSVGKVKIEFEWLFGTQADLFNIYHDSGTGTVDFSAPAFTFNRQTTRIQTFTTTQLHTDNEDKTFKFVVRSQNSLYNEDSNTDEYEILVDGEEPDDVAVISMDTIL